jgi:hypothetical protein
MKPFGTQMRLQIFASILIAVSAVGQNLDTDAIKAAGYVSQVHNQMRDPESFRLERVTSRGNKDGYSNICVYFRSHNGFGGYEDGVYAFLDSKKGVRMLDVSVDYTPFTHEPLNQRLSEQRYCQSNRHFQQLDITGAVEKQGEKSVADTATAPSQQQKAAPANNPQAEPPAESGVPMQSANVTVKSTPQGADINVDGKFMGSTPSTIQLSPGEHLVSVEKEGMRPWQRTMTVSAGGSITIDATLEKR